MKLWLDDVRPAPEGFLWAHTAENAILALATGTCEYASLDHDLGADPADGLSARGDSRYGCGCLVVNWMIENDVIPPTVAIHSWNAVAAERMGRALLNAGAPHVIVSPYRIG